MREFFSHVFPPSKEEGTKLTPGGHEVQLSKPRLVARRLGFLWFPTLLQFDDKNLAAVEWKVPPRSLEATGFGTRKLLLLPV